MENELCKICPFKIKSEGTPVPCVAEKYQCDSIKPKLLLKDLILKTGKKVFIICSVRGCSDDYKEALEEHTKWLEENNKLVHLPHRDTDQGACGFDICKQNMDAIRKADVIHIFYNGESQGTHFDMGVAFAFNKQIIVIENEEFGKGKSYPRMLTEWQSKIDQ